LASLGAPSVPSPASAAAGVLWWALERVYDLLRDWQN
jgi:hypothetical protein